MTHQTVSVTGAFVGAVVATGADVATGAAVAAGANVATGADVTGGGALVGVCPWHPAKSEDSRMIIIQKIEIFLVFIFDSCLDHEYSYEIAFTRFGEGLYLTFAIENNIQNYGSLPF